MIPPNFLYSVVCLVSSIEMVSLSFLSWRYRRHTPWARPLGFLLFFCGVYVFGYAFEIMRGDVAWFYLWLRVEYCGLAFIPLSFLWTSMEFTGILRGQKRVLLSAFGGFSGLILTAVFTNHLHHLYYASLGVDTRGPFPTALFERGVLYYAQTFVLFLSLLLGNAFYLRHFLQKRYLLRNRALVPVVAGWIGLAVVFIYVLRIIPWSVDIGPLAIAANGVLFGWAIPWAGFLDISPIAREEVFESMQDGVIVTDARGIVVDFNPAASRCIPGLSEKWLGQSLAEVAPELEGYFSPDTPFESQPFSVWDGGTVRFYEVRKVPIQGRRGHIVGIARYMREITERYQLLEKLREQAERDSLTGVWNRRKWMELAQSEMKRAERYKRPLALAILDIDHFKLVNDTVGHEGGDLVLRELSQAILLHLRENDLFGRIGGEEFAILFPEVGREKAQFAAERIRQMVAEKRIVLRERPIAVTVSIGLTVWEGTETLSFEDLLRQADQALYRAKELRRDRVVIHSPGPSPPR